MMGHRLCPQSRFFASWNKGACAFLFLYPKPESLDFDDPSPSETDKTVYWKTITFHRAEALEQHRGFLLFFFFLKKPSAYICMNNLNNEKEKNRQSNSRSKINLNAEK